MTGAGEGQQTQVQVMALLLASPAISFIKIITVIIIAASIFKGIYYGSGT